MDSPYLKYLKDELTDRTIYEQLAAREKNPDNRALLQELAAKEMVHYEFWRALEPGAKVSPNKLMVAFIFVARRILGVTFAVKFLERHEEHLVEEYRKLLTQIDPAVRAGLEAIIADESNYEKEIIARLKEKRVDYLGFIVLGLADAIVEITGVHAGFLGVTGSTLIAGISGVIVGVAAAISMGSAAYLQAKQDPEKSAFISAFTTGLSYFFSVILLALPYFLITSMFPAFVISTTIGTALLALFTFYGAVIADRKFFREFSEAFFLMLGTALITYILGNLLGNTFHVNEKSF